ncbi:MAG: FAD-dependent oxidoreductase [Pseudomonas aeruginosa]|nr:FAD-dependent oxidoreductase [Pseudomonas aeruginosa]
MIFLSLRPLVPSLLALALTGCAVGPDFRPAPVPAPDDWSSWRSGGAEVVGPAGSPGSPSAQWWRVFDDATLDHLQQRALEASPDLQTAALRYAQARVQRQTVAAQRGPAVGIEAGASRQRTSEYAANYRVLDQLAGGNRDALAEVLGEPYTFYQAGFDASWELDLWGRVRRSVEAADADIDASAALLDAARLRDLEPVLRPGLAGALKVPGDGILYAPNAARWLLERAGPRLRRLHAEVSEVDGSRLRLADGRWLSAEALVLANGIHAGELCAELPIRPKKGHLLITDRYPGTLRHQLVELGYVSSAHASSGTSVAFNAQPRPTGQVFLGSSRQFDTLDPQVEGPVLARMLRRALDYLPGLAGLNAIRAWTGFRAATPDGLPLLGEHPAQPGLWLAVGHEGLGVTTAPGSARLLAAQLFGETPPLDATPYLPQRFLSSSGSARP